MKSRVQKIVLFICTGNYYRSRLAEILVNQIASTERIPVKAFSRGFAPYSPKNVGVISPNTMQYLEKINVVVHDYGIPHKLSLHDLESADVIVLMDEDEHRPMLIRDFPEWEEKVLYWKFEDDYVQSPDIIMPALDKKVRSFMDELKQLYNAGE